MFANPRTSTTQCSQTTTMASRSARCFFFPRYLKWPPFSRQIQKAKSFSIRSQLKLLSPHYSWHVLWGPCFTRLSLLLLVPILALAVWFWFQRCFRLWGPFAFCGGSPLCDECFWLSFGISMLTGQNAATDFDRHYIEAGKKRVRKKRHECKGSLCPLTHSSWFVQIIENIWKYIEIHWNISCIEIVNIYIYIFIEIYYNIVLNSII